MKTYIEALRQKTRVLKVEVYALYLAYQDPRVSWFARIFTACVVAYAFSPIDLIPDFVPIFGYLDDLILIPLGIRIALSVIPKSVMDESREKAKQQIEQGMPVNWIVAKVIILIWLVCIILLFNFFYPKIR